MNARTRSEMSPPVGSVAIAFTDIQGSTQLWERCTVAMREALDLHNCVLREALAAGGGYEVKTEGDSFMVTFSSPVDAVRWCLDVQTRLVEAEWPPALLEDEIAGEERAPDGRVLRRGLRVRIGVHSGEPDCRLDPTTERMDYFGPVVNRAARIGAAGHGGQILLSERVWRVIESQLASLGDPTPSDLGEHRMKDLESAEHLWQLAPKALAARTFPPLKTLDARKTNLQPHPTPFVGREADLQALAVLFARGERLVTLMGPGGTGKTRLSIRYAGVHLQDFTRDGGGGAWFCDLTEARTLEGICSSVGSALGVPLTTGKTSADMVTQLGHAIAGRGCVLLVLDNFEQVVAHGPETVGRWMKMAPESRFLVSTQERLRLPGEVPYELKPLPLPGDGTDPADSEAVQLFVQRAKAVRRDYQLTAADANAVAEIVRELDGIPLAIELAAARMGVLSAAKLLERLPRRFDLLGGANRASADRQATLRGAIDWSWNLLQPHGQDALAQCSVFAGGFSMEAAEEVLDLSSHPEAPFALDVVEALRDKSLLRAVESNDFPGELRFGMYASIREYASQRLAACGNKLEVEARHSTWVLRAGTEWACAAEGPDGVHVTRRLASELENLAAVFHRARTAPPTLEAVTVLLQALWVLDPVLSTRGPFGIHLEWLDAAVERARGTAVDPPLFARTLELRARVLRSRGRSADALADIEEALRSRRKGGEPSAALARTLAEKGAVLLQMGSSEDAGLALAEALQIAQAAKEREAEAEVLKNFGNLCVERADESAALLAYEKALALYRATGNRRWEGVTIGNMAVVLHRTARLPEARERYDAALAVHRETANRVFEGNALGSLAAVLHEQGALDDAREHYDRALAIQAEVGNRRSQAFFLGNRGILEHEDRRLTAARASLESAIEIFRELRDLRFEGLYQAFLGGVLAEQGDPVAPATLAAAREALDEIDHGVGLAVVDILSFLVELAADSPDARRRALAAIGVAEASPGPAVPSLAARSDDLRFAIRLLRRRLG